jgi:hypothetical protein
MFPNKLGIFCLLDYFPEAPGLCLRRFNIEGAVEKFIKQSEALLILSFFSTHPSNHDQRGKKTAESRVELIFILIS